MICFGLKIFGFYVKYKCVKFQNDTYLINLICSLYLKWSCLENSFLIFNILNKKVMSFISYNPLNLIIRPIIMMYLV